MPGMWEVQGSKEALAGCERLRQDSVCWREVRSLQGVCHSPSRAGKVPSQSFLSPDPFSAGSNALAVEAGLILITSLCVGT